MTSLWVSLAGLAAVVSAIVILIVISRRDAANVATSKQAQENSKGVIDAVGKAKKADDAVARLPDGAAGDKLRKRWSRD